MNSNLRAMSLEEVISKAPSVAATAPMHNVSDRYEFMPTTEVISTMMSRGWEPVQVSEQRARGERFGFQKHLIRFQHQSLMMGEELVQACMINSHDRSTAYQFLLGIWRMVCSNGMMAGETFGAVRVKHISINQTAVLAASEQLLETAPRLLQTVKEFKAISLTGPEQAAFAKSAMVLAYGEDVPFDPMKLLNVRRSADLAVRGTLWGTYNVVQENMIKGGIRYVTENEDGILERKKTRTIKQIDKDVKLNRALFTLAEEMAKIKS